MIKSMLLGFISIAMILIVSSVALSFESKAMKLCQQSYSYDYCFNKLHN